MASPGQHLRQRALDRAATVAYRYARGVLLDDAEALEVAVAALAGARLLSRRRRLVDTAHDLCRELAEAELEPAALAAQERDEARPPPAWSPCAQAELRASRDLDGRLDRRERALLLAHLAACTACAEVVEAMRAQRAALRIVLGMPQAPVRAGVYEDERRSRFS